MIVGCYSLQLYCNHQEAGQCGSCTAWPGEFTGRTESDCLRQARLAGWLIRKRPDEKVRCPKHRNVEALLARDAGGG